MFTWEDFKQFNVPPETLADYCNLLLQQRTVPVRLDSHAHDVVREDAGWSEDYLKDFPLKARMTQPNRK